MKKFMIPLLAGLFAVSACQQVSISNFDECTEAGFPIAESYPRQCMANGEVFVEEIEEELNNESDEPEENVATDSIILAEDPEFKLDENFQTYYGTAALKGYATISEKQEAFCEVDCSTVQYVFFHITETEDEVFQDYLDENAGNSYVGDSAIGLGCYEENQIRAWNDSNKYGMQEYYTGEETTAAIISSTKENPVEIEIERYLYTSGRGAPDCYSHFATINLK